MEAGLTISHSIFCLIPSKGDMEKSQERSATRDPRKREVLGGKNEAREVIIEAPKKQAEGEVAVHIC